MRKIILFLAVFYHLDTNAQNVGIGTASPAHKLDVAGDINTSTGFTLSGAAATGNYLRGNGTNFVSSGIQSGDLPAGSSNYIQNQTTQQASSNFNISGNGTIGGNAIVTGTVTAGSAVMGTGINGGYYQDGTNGAYRAIVSSSTTTGYYFQQNAGANTTMYVGLGGTYNGNVGIGTATPGAPLDVTGTATIGVRYIKTGAADARLSVGDKSGTVWSWSCGWGTGNGGAAGDYSLLQEGTSGDRLYFQAATGYVGIGTVVPAYNLDVTGTERVTGNLTVGGAITGRVWSSNLSAAVNYSPASNTVGLLSVAATSHGGTFVIMGKVEDVTTSNFTASRNIIYLYRTTSATAYTSTGSTLLDTWDLWTDAGGTINESAVVTYSEQLTAGTTYYYWLVGSGDGTETRQAQTSGTRIIVYEF